MLSLAVPTFAAPRQTPTATASPAFAPKYLEVVPLRFADAATVAKTLNAQRLPKGVLRVKVNPDNAKSLQILGTADGVAELKAIIALVDVPLKKATFQVTIERVQFGADGVRDATVVDMRTLIFSDNEPKSYAVTDKYGDTLAASLTARIPSDTTKRTLQTTFGWMNAKGYRVGLERFAPLPVGKKTVNIVGVTFADESDFVATLGVGKIPQRWQGKPLAYVLSVLPVKEPK